MFRTLAITVAIGPLLSAVPAFAQQGATPGAESNDASMEAAARDFLNRKQAAQARREERLRGSGRANAIPQLRRLIAQSDFVRPSTTGVSGATQESLRESLITDAAQYLAAADFAPNRVSAYLRAGFNPLDAAISIVRGSPSARDAAVLANRVVVGRVTDVEDTGTAEEPTSIVTLTVTENVLGPESDTVRFEQGGSSANPLQATLLEGADDTFLVFLTDAAGNIRGNSRNATGEVATNLVSPFKLEGSQYRPLGLSTMRPVALSALKAEIAPLSALRVNQ